MLLASQQDVHKSKSSEFAQAYLGIGLLKAQKRRKVDYVMRAPELKGISSTAADDNIPAFQCFTHHCIQDAESRAANTMRSNHDWHKSCHVGVCQHDA